jgi:3'(2'), 5'-bisphosphate nucleotidase
LGVTEDILAKVIELSVIAGNEILKHYHNKFTVEYKKDGSPVTIADKSANKIIVEGLMHSFPEIPVLAEESADDPARLNHQYCFVVDPLDGTREYIKRNGEFTVNIALVFKGRPIVGVIYAPVLKELYYAKKGMGAYSLIDGNKKRIFVSERAGDIRLAKSRTNRSDDLDRLIEKNNITDIIIAGSSYKGCLVARGDVEAYYRFGPTMEWDTAAMDIIVTEAGGIFAGIDDTEFIYNKKNPLNPSAFYAINKKENLLEL